MLVEKEVWAAGRLQRKYVWEADPPVPQSERWIDGSTLVGLEQVCIIPPWHTTWAIPLPCVEYQNNQALAARLGLTEETCWSYDKRHLIILHHGVADAPTRLPDNTPAPRGHCFYDADVAIKHTRIMSDWVSKEFERSEQRRRVKARLDDEANQLARQHLERARHDAEIQRQQLENSPEMRMRKLEDQMKAVMEENKRLRNGGSHES
jgi:hypothetical protein